MIVIPNSVKLELKKPLGRVSYSMEEVKKLSRKKKIVTVGDICTLALLAIGVKPHLAVFDYRYMRKKLNAMLIGVLENTYKKRTTYGNKPGTLSIKLLCDAPQLLKKGGAVLINGDEDLTALAFILTAKKEHIVVYGQPKEGIVIVKPKNRIKTKIEKMLAATFSHKVK